MCFRLLALAAPTTDSPNLPWLLLLLLLPLPAGRVLTGTLSLGQLKRGGGGAAPHHFSVSYVVPPAPTPAAANGAKDAKDEGRSVAHVFSMLRRGALDGVAVHGACCTTALGLSCWWVGCASTQRLAALEPKPRPPRAPPALVLAAANVRVWVLLLPPPPPAVRYDPPARR